MFMVVFLDALFDTNGSLHGDIELYEDAIS